VLRRCRERLARLGRIGRFGRCLAA